MISRAAQQLNSLTVADSPLGMPLHGLQLQTGRTLLLTLPLPPPRPHDLGINNPSQSTQDGNATDALFDISCLADVPSTTPHESADIIMQEAHAAPLAADHQPQQMLIFVRTATSSSSVPLYIAPSAHFKDLAELLRQSLHDDPM